ncbi:Imm26 family immunity protein [Celerinatantimonas sp. MCCC 1A17872]|uniref:Imm26 family immunity protein n=1 Tax=Celerinatantimonas sp. MCCC 1A17872 TaxID=3177514 RepID=UPI0038C152A8
MKKILVEPGDIFLIPLFLHHESCIKSFSRFNFDKEGMIFCVGRVIVDAMGAGTIIEVFNRQVTNISSVDISNDERLFEPVVVAGEGFKKKRWRVIGHTSSYDSVTYSGYNDIKFIIGPRDNPRIWTPNGESYPEDDIDNIERMTVWTSDQIESRIVDLLQI